MLVHMAIGLAMVASVVPASLAQDSGVLDHCTSAGTEIDAEERQPDQRAGSNTGVFVALPIGNVCVGPESVEGGYSYVRRTKVSEGMAIVEVSATPFVPEAAAGANLIGRTDLPAGW